MMKHFAILGGLLCLLSACNTISGMGRDLSRGGDALTDFAREVRGENTSRRVNVDTDYPETPEQTRYEERRDY